MADAPRVALSKKARFEVFKRDSFRCQYCGRSAPDVTLQVDHVEPVAAGGTNEILNLVTSCAECNAGKGARSLQDGSILAAQRDQLAALNERREQLEMLFQWKREVAAQDDKLCSDLTGWWSELSPGRTLTPHGVVMLRKWVAQYGASEVIESMQIAARTYADRTDENGTRVAFDMVGRICHTRKAEAATPGLRDIYYVRGILRNRISYVGQFVIALMKEAMVAGISADELKRLAKDVRSWTDFRDTVETWTTEAKAARSSETASG